MDPSGLSEEQLKEIPYTKIEWVYVGIFLCEYKSLLFFFHCELCHTEIGVVFHIISQLLSVINARLSWVWWGYLIILKPNILSFQNMKKIIFISPYLSHTLTNLLYVSMFCISPYAIHQSILCYMPQNQGELNANKQIHLFPKPLLPFTFLLRSSKAPSELFSSLTLLVMVNCQGIAVSLRTDTYFTVIIAHLGRHVSVQAAACGRNGILVCIIMCFPNTTKQEKLMLKLYILMHSSLNSFIFKYGHAS